MGIPHDHHNARFLIISYAVSGVIERCHNLVAHHIRAMNTFHVSPVGDGFQIIETYPDGRRSIIGGFSTEAAARAWLNNYIRFRGLNQGPLGKPSDPET
jgi:hypothetical protein